MIYTIHPVDGIQQIGSESWTRFADPPPLPLTLPYGYPFLKALEDSESVGASAGWVPYHLQVKDAEGAVQGVCRSPKGHSQGEYIFDYSWADAFERAGGRYYPSS